MKKLSILLSLILTFILAFSGVACGGSQILSLTAFSTTVRIEAHDKKISSQTNNKLIELFSSLEQEFDKDSFGSITYNLNNAGANEKIELTQTQKEVLTLSKEYYQFSKNFNPAIYPLVKLWGFDNFSLVVDFVKPQDQKIQEILAKGLTDYDQVQLQENYFCKTNAEVKIDLGGIVKGYAVDKALQIMLDDGHTSGYINVGNSSMALLSVNSLNISHPRKTGESILSVDAKNLTNVTLSTSGDYERYFEYDGKRYSHIIDPRTGYPIETGIASATVIGGTGAFSDALTTALCICQHNPKDFSSSELVSLIKKITLTYPESQIYVVYEKDGAKQVITNEKQGENFTLLDDEYTVINI